MRLPFRKKKPEEIAIPLPSGGEIKLPRSLLPGEGEVEVQVVDLSNGPKNNNHGCRDTFNDMSFIWENERAKKLQDYEEARSTLCWWNLESTE